MKTASLNKLVALALLILLLSFIPASAAGPGVVTTQGKVKGLQLKKNTMVIHEAEYIWDSKTLFYDEKGAPLLDEKGSPAKAERLRNKDWVYIVGVSQKNKPTLIRKIYLLPRYIKKSDMHLYPFMQ